MTMYTYKSKTLATRKLESLFDQEIRVNAQKIGNEYTIETIKQKQFYKDSVETQSEMPNYLEYIKQGFEPEDTQKQKKAYIQQQIKEGIK